MAPVRQSARVPPLPAPLDLKAKTARVEVPLSRTAARTGLKVSIAIGEGAPEVTRLNNEVTLR